MMFRIVSRAGLVALALLVSACASLNEVTAPGGDGQLETSPTTMPVRTDRASYDVRTTPQAYEVTIGVSFTNPTDGRVYIPTCRTPHPPILQKWENGQWVTAYSPVVLMCLGPPVVIEAGETYDYSYNVVASRRPNTSPHFEVNNVPGTYRLQWSMLRSWTPDGPEPGLGEPLPLELTTSNTFELRLQ